MEWTDIAITVPRTAALAAEVVATGVAGGGLHIEDYADLEAQVKAIAHVDLIEEELLQKPRDVVIIHLYLSSEDNVAQVVETLQGRLLAAEVPYQLAQKGVQQEAWESSWKQYYHPIEIGSRLAVAPSWEEYVSERVTLRLDPGMAFGTGTHETTFLCMEALDERVRGGERALDIGTGSGILAVAALLLGAERAEGIDIDPLAVKTAAENAQRNNVQDRLQVNTGDLASAASGKYDIITANIVADAIIRLAPEVPKLLDKNGIFIASGIIVEREEEVAVALRAAGLQLLAPLRKNGWSALLAQHQTAEVKMAHRYFTTDITGEQARITGPDAAHLAKVLRVQKGEQLILCDGTGTDYDAKVASAAPEEVILHILKSYPTAAEPNLRAEVYVGYGKGDRMEWAVQKAVELGAARIVPFFSKYTVVKAKNEEQKNRRYTRIAHEAAKQSGRGVLPQVALPLGFEQMLAEAVKADASLFCYEEGGATLGGALLMKPQTVAIITGPEGGFAPEEAEQAEQAGCVLVGLGPRILRCETAPVAALAAVMALTGNLE